MTKRTMKTMKKRTRPIMTGIPVFCHVLVGISAQPWSVHLVPLLNSMMLSKALAKRAGLMIVLVVETNGEKMGSEVDSEVL